MKIRKATSQDADICAAIAIAAYADYVPLMGQKPAPMLADYRAHIARDLVFIAERDAADIAEIVGFAIIVKKGDDYWLENIAVTPMASGRGLGKYLLGFIEDYLRPLCDRYQLYTNIKMKRNIDWYHALGFSETYRGEVDGYDRVYFEKRLS
ncbi:GNAT family N-acetyltransferase [Alphaproteobacteria bacterium]|nr:GNAT family N-acetyltransferase [Alphaproteobacteria bacterium]